MASNNKKIIRYRRIFRPNIGLLMFFILFVYLTFSVYTYLGRTKIGFYEVVDGGIVNNKQYNGIILRQELTQNASDSGYINYYIREGKRTGVGSRIYSLDETGNLTAYLENNSINDESLTSDNLYEFKKKLATYSMKYTDNNFSTVYDDKISLTSALMEYSSLNVMDNLDDIMKANGINYTQVKSPETGVVAFSIDGFENTTAEQITAADFDKTSYLLQYNKAGELVEKGSPVYKIITSENWSLVFPLLDDDKNTYKDDTNVTVDFKSRNMSIDGILQIITGADGQAYGQISFDKYMVNFVDDRYVSFEIKTKRADGLKIPKSSVTSKTFFTVPIDFLTHGGNDIDEGFYKEVYSDSGTSVEYVPTEIFYQTNDSYYINAGNGSEFKSGDYILKPNSQDRYQIGVTADLNGVYNINKGYAVFKQIDTIATNEEYYTISKNMKYGLAVYDHIILNAKNATEGEFLYQ